MIHFGHAKRNKCQAIPPPMIMMSTFYAFYALLVLDHWSVCASIEVDRTQNKQKHTLKLNTLNDYHELTIIYAQVYPHINIHLRDIQWLATMHMQILHTFPIPVCMHTYGEHAQTYSHTHSQSHKQLYIYIYDYMDIDRVNLQLQFTSAHTHRLAQTNPSTPT